MIIICLIGTASLFKSVNELRQQSTGLLFCVFGDFNRYFCKEKIQTNVKLMLRLFFLILTLTVNSYGCAPLEEICGNIASSTLVWARLVLGDSASWQSSGSWQKLSNPLTTLFDSVCRLAQRYVISSNTIDATFSLSVIHCIVSGLFALRLIKRLALRLNWRLGFLPVMGGDTKFSHAK